MPSFNAFYYTFTRAASHQATSFPRFPLGHQRHWSLPHSSSDTATLSTAARSCCSRARYQIRVGYARVHELRKLNGKRLMPWLSVRTKDASLCSAVIQPLVLVPLISLGRRAVATEASGAQAGSSAIGAADLLARRRRAGGPRLRATCLSEELFAGVGMQVVRKDLMSMKVTELKEELERGERHLKTGATRRG